jgi:hypothetical protein
MMHRQASFIEGFMPDDVDRRRGRGLLLPAGDRGVRAVGAPVLIAGDLAAAYTDNPSLAEFFQYFATAGVR